MRGKKARKKSRKPTRMRKNRRLSKASDQTSKSESQLTIKTTVIENDKFEVGKMSISIWRK